MKYFAFYFFLNFSFWLNAQVNTDSKGVAAEGYDPVAYFQGQASKGSSEWKVKHENTLYFFSSVENRQLFLKNPTSYLPQYGGWCAYAMGKTGEKVEIDPETFEIREGKLYLFYNRYFNNTYKSWLKEDPVKLRHQADLHWQKLHKNPN